jgi:hypothetical protein
MIHTLSHRVATEVERDRTTASRDRCRFAAGRCVRPGLAGLDDHELQRSLVRLSLLLAGDRPKTTERRA